MNKKRVEVGDAQAIEQLGSCYYEGIAGLPQDLDKALELWHQAAELDCAKAYFSIGNAYYHGRGVERDEKKAIHYWELAAAGGVAQASHNLGCLDSKTGNYDRAIKHFNISVRSGHNRTLKTIQQLYSNGRATKDDYAKALRAYQSYLSEIKSDGRDKAAAHHDSFKYYE